MTPREAFAAKLLRLDIDSAFYLVEPDPTPRQQIDMRCARAMHTRYRVTVRPEQLGGLMRYVATFKRPYGGAANKWPEMERVGDRIVVDVYVPFGREDEFVAGLERGIAAHTLPRP